MKKLLLIVILSLILIIGCSSKELSNKQNEPIVNEQTPPILKEQPTLKFSLGVCDITINPYQKPTEGILNKEWKDDVLVINAFVKTFCGGANITGDFNLEGSNLNLIYNIKTDGPVTSCLCAHMLTYEFSNLEHKDYLVSIKPQ